MFEMFPPNNTAKELLLWSTAQRKLATPEKYPTVPLREKTVSRENILLNQVSPKR